MQRFAINRMDMCHDGLTINGTAQTRGYYRVEDGQRVHERPSEFYVTGWATTTAKGVEWGMSALGRQGSGCAISTAAALVAIIAELGAISAALEQRIARDNREVEFIGEGIRVGALYVEGL